MNFPVTVQSVQKKLLESFEDLGSVSMSTVKRTIKYRLHLSYKKLSKYEIRFLSQTHFRRMIISSILLRKLQEK